MISDALATASFLYGLGILNGALLAWWILDKRHHYGPGVERIARDNAVYHVIMRAASDVLEDDDHDRVIERSNELLEDEYDIPGGPVVHRPGERGDDA